MFEGSAALAWDRREYGRKAAVELIGDIHEYTRLYGPKEPVGYPSLNARQLFDFNEHFMEWGSPVRDRVMVTMLIPVLMLMVVGPFWLFIVSLLDAIREESVDLFVVGSFALFGFACYGIREALTTSLISAQRRMQHAQPGRSRDLTEF